MSFTFFNSIKRIIAFFVAFTFVWGNNVPLSHASISVHAAPQKNLPADLASVQIPEKLGKIQEAFQGTNGRTVVLIQDAHAIPAAQQSIQEIIRHFQKEYGVDLTAVEGASSELDMQIFRSFPDKELLKKIFDDYLKEGELTGPVAAAVFNPGKQVYHGIEDWQLYEQGLRLYLDAFRTNSEVSRKIEIIETKLQKEKEAAYSKQLLEVDRKLLDFYDNEAEVADVLKVLSSIKAPKNSRDLAAFIHAINNPETPSQTLEAEIKAAVDKIKPSLETDESREFNQKRQAFQTSTETAESFALYLRELAARKGLPAKFSSVSNRLADHHKRMRDMEGQNFYRDFEVYASEVKKSLFQNEAQRALDLKTTKLIFLKRLGKLEISRDQWRDFKNKLDPEFRETFKAHLGFYENARQREESFSRNLNALMQKRRRSQALLVAGGFHAAGLAEKLKAEGTSYLLITPEISNLPEVVRYQDLMKGSVSWKEYLRVEKGKINLYDAFVRAVRDKLLAYSVERIADRKSKADFLNAERSTLNTVSLKNWRDQIIRDLAAHEKIAEIGKYSRFIDELPQQKKNNPEWFVKIEKFLEGLRKLDSQGNLTAPNILNLAAPAALQALGGNVAPRTFLSADLAGFRSEMRGDTKEIDLADIKLPRQDESFQQLMLEAGKVLQSLGTPYATPGMMSDGKADETLANIHLAFGNQGVKTAAALAAKFKNRTGIPVVTSGAFNGISEPATNGSFYGSLEKAVSMVEALWEQLLKDGQTPKLILYVPQPQVTRTASAMIALLTAKGLHWDFMVAPAYKIELTELPDAEILDTLIRTIGLSKKITYGRNFTGFDERIKPFIDTDEMLRMYQDQPNTVDLQSDPEFKGGTLMFANGGIGYKVGPRDIISLRENLFREVLEKALGPSGIEDQRKSAALALIEKSEPRITHEMKRLARGLLFSSNAIKLVKNPEIRLSFNFEESAAAAKLAFEASFKDIPVTWEFTITDRMIKHTLSSPITTRSGVFKEDEDLLPEEAGKNFSSKAKEYFSSDLFGSYVEEFSRGEEFSRFIDIFKLNIPSDSKYKKVLLQEISKIFHLLRIRTYTPGMLTEDNPDITKTNIRVGLDESIPTYKAMARDIKSRPHVPTLISGMRSLSLEGILRKGKDNLENNERLTKVLETKGAPEEDLLRALFEDLGVSMSAATIYEQESDNFEQDMRNIIADIQKNLLPKLHGEKPRIMFYIYEPMYASTKILVKKIFEEQQLDWDYMFVYVQDMETFSDANFLQVLVATIGLPEEFIKGRRFTSRSLIEKYAGKSWLRSADNPAAKGDLMLFGDYTAMLDSDPEKILAVRDGSFYRLLEETLSRSEMRSGRYTDAIWYKPVSRNGPKAKALFIRYSSQYRYLREYLLDLLESGKFDFSQPLRIGSFGAGNGAEAVSIAGYLEWLKENADNREHVKSDRRLGALLRRAKIEIHAVEKDDRRVAQINALLKEGAQAYQEWDPLTVSEANESSPAIMGMIRRYLPVIQKNPGLITIHHRDLNAFLESTSLSFDVVFANEIFQYLDSDFSKAWSLLNSRPVLKENAVLLTSERDEISKHIRIQGRDEDSEEPFFDNFDEIWFPDPMGDFISSTHVLKKVRSELRKDIREAERDDIEKALAYLQGKKLLAPGTDMNVTVEAVLKVLKEGHYVNDTELAGLLKGILTVSSAPKKFLEFMMLNDFHPLLPISAEDRIFSGLLWQQQRQALKIVMAGAVNPAVLPTAAGTFVPAMSRDVLFILRQETKPGDYFFDLGSGTGHVLALASHLGLKATGVELDDRLYEQSLRLLDSMETLAKGTKSLFSRPDVRVLKQNFMELDFKNFGGDVPETANRVFFYYAAGSKVMSDPVQKRQFLDKLKNLPAGSKVIFHNLNNKRDFRDWELKSIFGKPASVIPGLDGFYTHVYHLQEKRSEMRIGSSIVRSSPKSSFIYFVEGIYRQQAPDVVSLIHIKEALKGERKFEACSQAAQEILKKLFGIYISALQSPKIWEDEFGLTGEYGFSIIPVTPKYVKVAMNAPFFKGGHYQTFTETHDPDLISLVLSTETNAGKTHSTAYILPALLGILFFSWISFPALVDISTVLVSVIFASALIFGRALFYARRNEAINHLRAFAEKKSANADTGDVKGKFQPGDQKKEEGFRPASDDTFSRSELRAGEKIKEFLAELKKTPVILFISGEEAKAAAVSAGKKKKKIKREIKEEITEKAKKIIKKLGSKRPVFIAIRPSPDYPGVQTGALRDLIEEFGDNKNIWLGAEAIFDAARVGDAENKIIELKSYNPKFIITHFLEPKIVKIGLENGIPVFVGAPSLKELPEAVLSGSGTIVYRPESGAPDKKVIKKFSEQTYGHGKLIVGGELKTGQIREYLKMPGVVAVGLGKKFEKGDNFEDNLTVLKFQLKKIRKKSRSEMRIKALRVLADFLITVAIACLFLTAMSFLSSFVFHGLGNFLPLSSGLAGVIDRIYGFFIVGPLLSGIAGWSALSVIFFTGMIAGNYFILWFSRLIPYPAAGQFMEKLKSKSISEEEFSRRLIQAKNKKEMFDWMKSAELLPHDAVFHKIAFDDFLLKLWETVKYKVIAQIKPSAEFAEKYKFTETAEITLGNRKIHVIGIIHGAVFPFQKRKIAAFAEELEKRDIYLAAEQNLLQAYGIDYGEETSDHVLLENSRLNFLIFFGILPVLTVLGFLIAYVPSFINLLSLKSFPAPDYIGNVWNAMEDSSSRGIYMAREVLSADTESDEIVLLLGANHFVSAWAYLKKLADKKNEDEAKRKKRRSELRSAEFRERIDAIRHDMLEARWFLSGTGERQIVELQAERLERIFLNDVPRWQSDLAWLLFDISQSLPSGKSMDRFRFALSQEAAGRQAMEIKFLLNQWLEYPIERRYWHLVRGLEAMVRYDSQGQHGLEDIEQERAGKAVEKGVFVRQAALTESVNDAGQRVIFLSPMAIRDKVVDDVREKITRFKDKLPKDFDPIIFLGGPEYKQLLIKKLWEKKYEKILKSTGRRLVVETADILEIAVKIAEISALSGPQARSELRTADHESVQPAYNDLGINFELFRASFEKDGWAGVKEQFEKRMREMIAAGGTFAKMLPTAKVAWHLNSVFDHDEEDSIKPGQLVAAITDERYEREWNVLAENANRVLARFGAPTSNNTSHFLLNLTEPQIFDELNRLKKFGAVGRWRPWMNEALSRLIDEGAPDPFWRQDALELLEILTLREALLRLPDREARAKALADEILKLIDFYYQNRQKQRPQDLELILRLASALFPEKTALDHYLSQFWTEEFPVYNSKKQRAQPLAISPDGRFMVIYHDDSREPRLELFNTRTQEPLEASGLFGVKASDIFTFSPDSQRLIVRADRNISRIIDPLTGKQVGQDHSLRGIGRLYFLQDGLFLDIVDWEIVHRFDLNTGVKTGEFSLTGYEIFSNDRSRKVRYLQNQVIQVLDHEGNKLGPARKVPYQATIQFSPDDKRLLTSGEQTTDWRLIDAVDGRLIEDFEYASLGKFSPDGRFLGTILQRDRGFRLINAADGSHAWTLSDGVPVGFNFSEDNGMIAVKHFANGPFQVMSRLGEEITSFSPNENRGTPLLKFSGGAFFGAQGSSARLCHFAFQGPRSEMRTEEIEQELKPLRKIDFEILEKITVKDKATGESWEIYTEGRRPKVLYKKPGSFEMIFDVVPHESPDMGALVLRLNEKGLLSQSTVSFFNKGKSVLHVYRKQAENGNDLALFPGNFYFEEFVVGSHTIHVIMEGGNLQLIAVRDGEITPLEDIDLKGTDRRIFTLGRDLPDLDFHVPDDAGVSRKHAKIRVSGKTVSVKDLGSENGTKVKGVKISHKVFTPLDPIDGPPKFKHAKRPVKDGTVLLPPGFFAPKKDKAAPLNETEPWTLQQWLNLIVPLAFFALLGIIYFIHPYFKSTPPAPKEPPAAQKRSELRTATAAELPPAAVSFQVADLKFGPDGVKILEIQPGLSSELDGFDGPDLKDAFWRYLGSLGLKGFHAVTDLEVFGISKKIRQARYGENGLTEAGGALVTRGDVQSLAGNEKFKTQKAGFNQDDIGTYNGVLVDFSEAQPLGRLQSSHPQWLVLDQQGDSRFFLADKFLMSTLFTGDLESARPNSKIFSKNLDPKKMAEEIRSAVPSHSGKYAIKAVDSTRGRGFIAVEADKLEEVLTKISLRIKTRETWLDRELKENLREPEVDKNPYDFWALDEHPGILVEELVASKPVEVNGKHYDGTIRVSYVMTYDRLSGKSKIKILGYFWKLPKTPLGEGSLRETVLSRMHPDGQEKPNSAKVSEEDQAELTAQLEKILPELYTRMISVKAEKHPERSAARLQGPAPSSTLSVEESSGELSVEEIVRRLQIAAYEQKDGEIEWYLRLARKLNDKEGYDPKLSALIRESSGYGSSWHTYRKARKGVDAYYGGRIVRDVLEGSRRAVESLNNPGRQELLWIEFMENPNGEKFFERAVEFLKKAVWKSAGVRMPLGDMQALRDGVSGETRESFIRILQNLARQIEQRAKYVSAKERPVVVRETLATARMLEMKLNQKLDGLTGLFEEISEGMDLPEKIEAALGEKVEEAGGQEFPLINHYREEGILAIENKRMKGIEAPVPVLIFPNHIEDVDLAYFSAEENKWRLLYKRKNAGEVSKEIMKYLSSRIRMSVPFEPGVIDAAIARFNNTRSEMRVVLSIADHDFMTTVYHDSMDNLRAAVAKIQAVSPDQAKKIVAVFRRFNEIPEEERRSLSALVKLEFLTQPAELWLLKYLEFLLQHRMDHYQDLPSHDFFLAPVRLSALRKISAKTYEDKVPGFSTYLMEVAFDLLEENGVVRVSAFPDFSDRRDDKELSARMVIALLQIHYELRLQEETPAAELIRYFIEEWMRTFTGEAPDLSAKSQQVFNLITDLAGKISRDDLSFFREVVPAVDDAAAYSVLSPGGAFLASQFASSHMSTLDRNSGQRSSFPVSKNLKLFDQARISPIQISRHGKFLVWSGDSRVRDLEAKSSFLLGGEEKVKRSSVYSFSPDEARVAGGGFYKNAKVSVWSLKQKGTLLWETKINKEKEILSITYSPDGETLAVGLRDLHQILILDAKKGTVLKVLSGHKAAVNSVSFSPDGKFLASGSSDNTAVVWDLSTDKQAKKLTFKEPVFGVAFSLDGRHLILREYSYLPESNKKIRFFQTGDWKELKNPEIEFLGNRFALSPDGEWLTIAQGKQIEIWDFPALIELMYRGPRSEMRAALTPPRELESDHALNFYFMMLLASQKLKVPLEDLIQESTRILNIGLETRIGSGMLNADNIVTYLRKRGFANTWGLDIQAPEDDERYFRGSVENIPQQLKDKTRPFNIVTSAGLLNPEYAERVAWELGYKNLEEFYAKVAAEIYSVLSENSFAIINIGTLQGTAMSGILMKVFEEKGFKALPLNLNGSAYLFIKGEAPKPRLTQSTAEHLLNSVILPLIPQGYSNNFIQRKPWMIRQLLNSANENFTVGIVLRLLQDSSGGPGITPETGKAAEIASALNIALQPFRTEVRSEMRAAKQKSVSLVDALKAQAAELAATIKAGKPGDFILNEEGRYEIGILYDPGKKEVRLRTYDLDQPSKERGLDALFNLQTGIIELTERYPRSPGYSELIVAIDAYNLTAGAAQPSPAPVEAPIAAPVYPAAAQKAAAAHHKLKLSRMIKFASQLRSWPHEGLRRDQLHSIEHDWVPGWKTNPDLAPFREKIISSVVVSAKDEEGQITQRAQRLLGILAEDPESHEFLLKEGALKITFSNLVHGVEQVRGETGHFSYRVSDQARETLVSFFNIPQFRDYFWEHFNGVMEPVNQMFNNSFYYYDVTLSNTAAALKVLFQQQGFKLNKNQKKILRNYIVPFAKSFSNSRFEHVLHDRQVTEPAMAAERWARWQHLFEILELAFNYPESDWQDTLDSAGDILISYRDERRGEPVSLFEQMKIDAINRLFPRSELRMAAEKVVDSFKEGSGISKDEAVRIEKEGPKIIAVIRKAAFDEKKRDERRVSAGYAAITSIDGPKIISWDFSKQAPDEKLINSMAGAVSAQKWLAVRLQNVKLTDLQKHVRLSKRSEVRMSPLAGTDDFILHNAQGGFDLNQAPALVIRPGFSARSELRELDSLVFSDGKYIAAEDTWKIFPAGLLYLADPLSQKTDKIINARSELRFSITGPAAFGVLEALGSLLAGSRASAYSA